MGNNLKLKVYVNGVTPIHEGPDGPKTGEHVSLGGDLATTLLLSDPAQFGKLSVGSTYELDFQQIAGDASPSEPQPA